MNDAMVNNRVVKAVLDDLVRGPDLFCNHTEHAGLGRSAILSGGGDGGRVLFNGGGYVQRNCGPAWACR